MQKKSTVKKVKPAAPATRELMNLKEITPDGILETLDGFRLAFLIVAPYNVTVLGRNAVLERISRLRVVLEGVGRLEILCLMSVQSYDQNIAYLKQRMADPTTTPVIRALCQRDIDHFSEISATMSTNREFLFGFRFRGKGYDLIRQQLQQHLQLIREQGFSARPAGKSDMKRILGTYWAQNMHVTEYPDFDGAQYLDDMEPEEMDA